MYFGPLNYSNFFYCPKKINRSLGWTKVGIVLNKFDRFQGVLNKHSNFKEFEHCDIITRDNEQLSGQ